MEDDNLDKGSIDRVFCPSHPKTVSTTDAVLAGPSPEALRAEALRTELEGLGLKELRHRARAAGADEEALEDATDAEEPKVAVTALLMGLVLAEGAGEGVTLPEGVPP